MTDIAPFPPARTTMARALCALVVKEEITGDDEREEEEERVEQKDASSPRGADDMGELSAAALDADNCREEEGGLLIERRLRLRRQVQQPQRQCSGPTVADGKVDIPRALLLLLVQPPSPFILEIDCEKGRREREEIGTPPGWVLCVSRALCVCERERGQQQRQEEEEEEEQQEEERQRSFLLRQLLAWNPSLVQDLLWGEGGWRTRHANKTLLWEKGPEREDGRRRERDQKRRKKGGVSLLRQTLNQERGALCVCPSNDMWEKGLIGCSRPGKRKATKRGGEYERIFGLLTRLTFRCSSRCVGGRGRSRRCRCSRCSCVGLCGRGRRQPRQVEQGLLQELHSHCLLSHFARVVRSPSLDSRFNLLWPCR